MNLQFLKLIGWRNYVCSEFSFAPGINLIVGGNGQGKTNLLEAIYFLTTATSPRTVNKEELINWQSSYFFLQGQLNKANGTVKLEMGLARNGRKAAKVNGNNVQSMSELVAQVSTVLFMPEDLDLIKGGPASRRRFIDVELGQMNTAYLSGLFKCRQILRERNALLKSKGKDPILMDVLTEKLVAQARTVTKKRQEFIERLSPLARLQHRKLSNGKEELTLIYKPSIDPGQSPETVLNEFASIRQKEVKYGTTLLGPHRDDIDVLLNGNSLRCYGSQGQQRTAVLALKLAVLELIRAETDEYPLLLLDDVFSELDAKRKALLLDYLQGRVQTFISSAEGLQAREAKVFTICRGQVVEKEGEDRCTCI